MGNVLVGITSWTEPSLVASGRFYPSSADTAENRLKFYSSKFPIVEVDSSYYSMPNEGTANLWVARTPDKFIFDIKAFRLFTQHQTSPTGLPKDIREALPPEIKTKEKIYYSDVPYVLKKELWQRFAQAILPLKMAGKLGIVLFQFAPWFTPGDKEKEYIAYCQKMLPQYRLAIEFRNALWTNQDNLEQTFKFLKERNLAYVCCDEPQGFKSSVPFIAEATSDIGVVRFHGRNKEAWDKAGLTAAERFNYLYSEKELKEFVPKIKDLSLKTQQLHVLFNNCYGDKAVINASQVKVMVS